MSTTQTSTQNHHDASNVNLNDMDVTAMTRHGVPNGLQTEKQWSLKSSQLHMKSIMSIVKKRCGKGKQLQPVRLHWVTCYYFLVENGAMLSA